MKKNIGKVFNKDVLKSGRYIYTNELKYSARIANQRITGETVNIIKKHLSNFKNLKVLDIGCGDGTYTVAVFNELKPKKIVGIDISTEGIKFAKKRIPQKNKNEITFEVGSIYEVDKMFKENDFDVVIIRGVLHHLENPKKAIKSVSKVFDKVIIFEPNGLNPILKVIEKVSPYHRLHQEKSYFPWKLDYWFKNTNFIKKDSKVLSIVPFFCSDNIAKFLKLIEPFFEKLIFIRCFYLGNYIAYYEKV